MSPKEVAIVLGSSRGIGRQVAIDLARNGFIVVVAGKTTSDASKCSPFPPDPNSQQSTINTVVREITEAGGEALALPVDVRKFQNVQDLVKQTVQRYKRLDVLVYSSGAIWWSSVEKTPMKRFQLMQRVNPEGLLGAVQACLPYFYQNGQDGKGRGRVVVISPPIYSRFLKGKTAYAMGKEGQTESSFSKPMLTSTSSAIESAATQNPQTNRWELRKPTIFSDAILGILKARPQDVNGRCLLDEDYLREHEGINDFSVYSLVPGSTPRRIMPASFPDLRVAEEGDEGRRMDSSLLRATKL